jgi:DNA-binding transcriptional regulator YdaS (Cro superfamily)
MKVQMFLDLLARGIEPELVSQLIRHELAAQQPSSAPSQEPKRPINSTHRRNLFMAWTRDVPEVTKVVGSILKAQQAVGGSPALAARLGVSEGQMQSMRQGYSMPNEFEAVVIADIIKASPIEMWAACEAASAKIQTLRQQHGIKPAKRRNLSNKEQ